MTKNQAIKAISLLTSGTIANIIGCAKYERIDEAVNNWICTIANTSESKFETCESWIDVLEAIK